MDELDRGAAAALRAAERPDVRSLRSSLDRVERAFDELLGAQEAEIERLRRLLVPVVKAYRLVQETKWGSATRTLALTDALDKLCLEVDALVFSGDLQPKRRPARRR